MKFLISLVLITSVWLGGCASSSTGNKADPAQAAEANAELGLQYMLNAQYEVAMEKLKRALDYDADNVNANHYMAELYNRLNRTKEAEKYFRRAVRLSGDNAALHNNFGVFLCGRKSYDEAEKEFLKALEDPVYRGRLDTMENIGICMLDKPDSKKAEEYLRKVLNEDARRPKTLLGMARISFEQKNYMSSRAYLQRYLEVGQHTPESLWLGIRTERILGDRDALASYGLLLKNAFPNAPETRLYLQSNKL